MSFKVPWSLVAIILPALLLEPINGKIEGEVIFAETFGGSEIFIATMKHHRISRGVFGIVGNATCKQDLNNDVFVEMFIYRSPLGTNQYQLLPMGSALGKLTFEEFMNKIYFKYIMPAVKDCSNLPQFEEKFIMPFKRGFYYANDCQVTDANIPESMLSGTYKIEAKFSRGKEHFGLRGIAKLESKI